jgi:hypothetical protein
VSSGTVLPLLALADDQVIAEAAIADPVTERHTAPELTGARLRDATVWISPLDEQRAGG